MSDYFVSYQQWIHWLCFSLPVTVISALLMTSLFISEFRDYLTPEVREEIFVDISRGNKLRINVDVIFHKIPCDCKRVIYYKTLIPNYKALFILPLTQIETLFLLTSSIIFIFLHFQRSVLMQWTFQEFNKSMSIIICLKRDWT